jgi:hypothetical protein
MFYLGILFLLYLPSSFGQECQTDYCTVAPCSASSTTYCTTFVADLIGTSSSTNTTDISISVTQGCSSDVKWVAFGLTSNVSVAGVPAGTTSISTPTTFTNIWSVEVTQEWLNFSFSNQNTNQFTNGNSDTFTFTLAGYYPIYPWDLKAGLSGPIVNSFKGAQFGQCECNGCDGAVDTRSILSCSLDYPNNTAGGRSATTFAESTVLYGFAISDSSILLYYNDEHALSLGVSTYIVGTETFNANFSYYPGTPSCVDFPFVGYLNWNSSSPLGMRRMPSFPHSLIFKINHKSY